MSEEPFEIFVSRLCNAASDSELARLGPGLDANVRLSDGQATVSVRLHAGCVEIGVEADADICIEAPTTAWQLLLSDNVPATFHAFTALQLANPQFDIRGDPLKMAQARPTLERLFELCVTARRGDIVIAARDLGQVSGRYHRMRALGETYEVYFEETSCPDDRPVVLFLHTAGADSRQFHGQMSDLELARRFRQIAFDLPFHGRSMPPLSWDGGAYRLTRDDYFAWVSAFIEQVVGRSVILAGCSMGAAMALCIASERPDLVSGTIAIEPPYEARGRKDQFQHHVGAHGGLHNASFVRGLMSPFSPECQRRRASWIYSQGAPGVYPGDLAFYSEEFNGADVAPFVDLTRTPVALLCGSYDYSASPEDGRKLHSLMPQAYFAEMPTLGHFPMMEDPDVFRPYLIAALAHVSGVIVGHPDLS